jgi:3-phenylpropionate/trans-cinnamate dioxygenase ferredoxin subunit
VTAARVARIDEVPEGTVRVVQCAARSLALSNVDGQVYAVDNICTHDGGPLGEGRLRGGRVICPRHGAAFDARTGKVLTLPAVKSVRAYAVTIDGDELLVDCEEGVLP